MISSALARRIILITIVLGFCSAFAALWWVSREGAASWTTVDPAIRRLLEVYMPLLGILAGFHFAEQALSGDKKISLETFLFAMVLISVWAFLAPLALLLNTTVDAAIRLLSSISVLGTSLAASALAFFFSKSARTVEQGPDGAHGSRHEDR